MTGRNVVLILAAVLAAAGMILGAIASRGPLHRHACDENARTTAALVACYKAVP